MGPGSSGGPLGGRAGQSTVEYVALLAVVALLLGSVVADPVAGRLAEAARVAECSLYRTVEPELACDDEPDYRPSEGVSGPVRMDVDGDGLDDGVDVDADGHVDGLDEDEDGVIEGGDDGLVGLPVARVMADHRPGPARPGWPPSSAGPAGPSGGVDRLAVVNGRPAGWEDPAVWSTAVAGGLVAAGKGMADFASRAGRELSVDHTSRAGRALKSVDLDPLKGWASKHAGSLKWAGRGLILAGAGVSAYANWSEEGNTVSVAAVETGIEFGAGWLGGAAIGLACAATGEVTCLAVGVGIAAVSAVGGELAAEALGKPAVDAARATIDAADRAVDAVAGFVGDLF